MDELMVDKLGQLCGLVNHESVDWAVADGDGGNDGAVGAPVPFARMSAAEFVIGVVPRVAQPLTSPCDRSCSRLWAKHPMSIDAVTL